MKSSNPRQTILDLLSEAPVDASTAAQKSRLLKLCGFTRAIDVQTALQSGINLIGLIFAKSPRTVTDEQVHEITQVVRKYGERTGAVTSLPSEIEKLKADKLSPKLWFQRCADVLRKVTVRQPLTVGVFQDQPIEFVSIILYNNICDVQLDSTHFNIHFNMHFNIHIHERSIITNYMINYSPDQ